MKDLLMAAVLTNTRERYQNKLPSSLLSSLGGSTGSKTLCMPGDGESRGSSPRFNSFFFLFFLSFF